MFKPDALIGTSLSIGIVGRITCCPSFVFNEDDAGVVPLFAKVAYPACSYIVTPECLKHENYGKKHLIYPGYHELAYLHPDHFTPDISVPRSIGLGPDKPYFILRLVALRAHHDTDAKGMPFDIAKKVIQILSEKGRVLITSEDELQDQFKEYQFPLAPDKLHDVLAFASMYIGESQTMAAEAAVLGVPNLRCNSFVSRISYLEELEKKFGLTIGFLPEQAGQILETVQAWLGDIEGIKHNLQLQRQKMLEKYVNLTEWQWQMLCRKLGY
jgi:predicted glycosyltransferase